MLRALGVRDPGSNPGSPIPKPLKINKIQLNYDKESKISRKIWLKIWKKNKTEGNRYRAKTKNKAAMPILQ